LHVLHVIEATIGGARRHVVDACRGLAGRGVETTLVCAALREPAMRRDMEELRGHGVDVCELPMLRAIRPHVDFGHLLELRRLLRERKPDVVHTHSSKAGVLGRLASRSTGVGARVHTPHTFAFLFGAMFGSRSRRLFRAVERSLAASTDRFIAVSQNEAATFAGAGFIPSEKVRVVPNGVDPQRWGAAQPVGRSTLGVPAGAPCVAVVGLLNVAKGQDLALRALAEPGLEALHLLVVGHGELLGAYTALASELGVAARTHFLGWRDDTPRLLKSVDALLLPSRWEGMPYIVLEAMAASLPVVATRVDGARGVLEEARCGVLCDVDSVESIAAGLRRLLALDTRGRAELAVRGRAAVEARYTLDRMVDGLVAVYRELA
jgi:glycosyltransferase involved in cell wall biosynthesis